MNRTIAYGAILCTGAGSLFGQPARQALKFEVASIRPSAPGTRVGDLQVAPDGGLRMTYVTLKQMITVAYNVRDYQVTGGPGWASSEHYDVVARPEASSGAAKVPDDLNKMNDEQLLSLREQVSARLQSLLAERFQLAARRESREQSVYALVIGKGGSRLKPSEYTGRRYVTGPAGKIAGHGMTPAEIAELFSQYLMRPVLDRTGLKGKFDFELSWAPGQEAAAARARPAGADASPLDQDAPSLFTAVQEQLGLRLESTKGPAEVIVIDHAEKASEN